MWSLVQEYSRLKNNKQNPEPIRKMVLNDFKELYKTKLRNILGEDTDDADTILKGIGETHSLKGLKQYASGLVRNYIIDQNTADKIIAHATKGIGLHNFGQASPHRGFPNYRPFKIRKFKLGRHKVKIPQSMLNTPYVRLNEIEVFPNGATRATFLTNKARYSHKRNFARGKPIAFEYTIRKSLPKRNGGKRYLRKLNTFVDVNAPPKRH